jgi:hypothetical protein
MGKTATETFRLLKQAYDDNAVLYVGVLMLFEWFEWFKDGHGDLQDYPRSGHSSTSGNADSNRRCPWNCDTRLSVGSQNDGR